MISNPGNACRPENGQNEEYPMLLFLDFDGVLHPQYDGEPVTSHN